MGLAGVGGRGARRVRGYLDGVNNLEGYAGGETSSGRAKKETGRGSPERSFGAIKAERVFRVTAMWIGLFLAFALLLAILAGAVSLTTPAEVWRGRLICFALACFFAAEILVNLPLIKGR